MKQGKIELIAVGHLTVDHVDGQVRPGGAAAYAALAARRLGVRAGIVTSFADDYPFLDLLSDIPTRVVGAKSTTVFENVYESGVRHQRIRSIASTIRPRHLRGIRVAEDAAVLYCPVAHEVEGPFVALSPTGLSGMAPQGFFRQWDLTGNVLMRQWDEAETALRDVDFVCMSEDDVTVPEDLAESLHVKTFVITKGANGCRVYAGAEIYQFPAFPATEVDPTGAGDVFAAAFLVSLRRGDALPRAAQVAAQEAAVCVESVGLEGMR